MLSQIATCLLVYALVVVSAGSIVEQATQHKYSDKDLLGVGVRAKRIGPVKVKVYSVGLYAPKSDVVKGFSKAKFASKADLKKSKQFEKVLIESKFARKDVVLRMARSISADTMADALSDAVQPRMKKGDMKDLKRFKSAICNGLGERGATQNTHFLFQMGGNKMVVKINNEKKAEINSRELCRAFMGVYCDKDSVSPSLKEDVSANIFGFLN